MERKRHTQEFKQQVIREVTEVGSQVEVARRHGLDPKLISRWVRESKHRSWEQAALDAKRVATYTPSPKEFREIEDQNDQLKKLLGEKDLEIQILRDLLKKTNPAYRTKLK